MGNVTIYLHKRAHDYADFLAELMGASRSEIIEDMIKYVRDEDLEEDVWGDDYKEAMKELEESEEEEEGESESESEEEEEGPEEEEEEGPEEEEESEEEE